MVLQIKNKTCKIPLYYLFLIAITALKLVLMGLFSSDYQDSLFYPFVMDFLDNGGNVYERFYNKGITDAFPYPCFMLFIECTGAFIIKCFGISNLFLRNMIFKLPSLVLDLIGCCLLSKLCGERRRYVAVLYYASPITIYSVYMHGQLDIIPTSLLIIALYFLMEKNEKHSIFLCALFMVVALLCKLHILAILPIMLCYLQKREGSLRTAVFAFTVGAGLLIGFIPFFSEGFMQDVLFNAEQSVLTKVEFSFYTVKMYIPMAAVLFIYLITFKLNYINRELFLNLCGIMFAVFLALCPPMPGWYVWIVPFFTLYFLGSNTEKYKNMIIYASMNLWYIIYFVFMHERDYVDLYFLGKDMSYIKLHEPTYSNLLFTLMAGTLFYLVYSMYQTGIASNRFYKRRGIPFAFGVSGDSGAGKTTMIGIIEKSLGSSNLLYIEGDGDHKWERGDKYWNDYTALNPKANFLYRQADDLRQLRKGGSVKRVEYDHSTGKFTAPKRVKPKKYVILCGLHALYLPQIRKNLDLMIYMDSDETLRRFWKIQRDTKERGHSKEAVLKSIEERMPDALKYIYPQKKYADLIIHYYDKELIDCMEENHDVKISVQLSVSAAINIEPVLNELEKYGVKANYDYSDDLRWQVVYFDADELEKAILPINEMATKAIPQLEEITRERFDTDISGKDGVIILFLLLLISNKMQGIP